MPETLEVTGAGPVGAWELSLRWNDLHKTGIYTWETLPAWCRCELCTGSPH
jgi:DUF971 family protein